MAAPADIKYDNWLVNVPFRISWSRQPDMSIHEQRIMIRIMEYCHAQLNGVTVWDTSHRVEYFKNTVEITMPVSDAFSKKLSSKQVEETLYKLRTRSFQYREQELWWCCGYIENPSVHHGKGMMTFAVSQRLWEIIKDYAKGFHRIELKKALELPTIYAMRFYLLMSERKGKLNMTIDFFRGWMGLPDDRYIDKNGNHRIDHLEERIIRPAKKALDETCPWSFTYEKVRENPKNSKSRVIGFVFHPVKQTKNQDSELEKQRLIAEISPSFLLRPDVLDYLKTNFGMTGQFLSPRKAKIKQWEDLEDDPMMWLAERKRKASEARDAKTYIFGAICHRIEELIGKGSLIDDTSPLSDDDPSPNLTTQIRQQQQIKNVTNELANLFNYDK